MLTTKRLRLRAYRPSDYDNIVAIHTDLSVLPYISRDFIVPQPTDTFNPIVQRIKDSAMCCMIEEIDGGAFVGFTIIMPIVPPKDRDARFGIALLPEFWHKGYGKEVTSFMVGYAFRALAAHRVSLSVFEGNDRAIDLYKRIGFVEEGRIRKLTWIDGSWRDCIHMGILDEEWVALQQKEVKS